jgi:hypothetical protein
MFHNNLCIYDRAASVKAGKVSVTMVVDKTAKDAGMVALTFDEGKTIDDLKALPPEADQPLWSHRIGEAARHVHPGENYTFEFTADTDPFYLVCFYGSLPEIRIGEIGPIAVTK